MLNDPLRPSSRILSLLVLGYESVGYSTCFIKMFSFVCLVVAEMKNSWNLCVYYAVHSFLRNWFLKKLIQKNCFQRVSDQALLTLVFCDQREDASLLITEPVIAKQVWMSLSKPQANWQWVTHLIGPMIDQDSK